MRDKAENTTLRELFSRFQTEGTFSEGKSFGPGHIHDTYRIITKEGWHDNYILQRINRHVFRNVEALQENMLRVTEHLKGKIAAAGGNVKRECLTLIPERESGRSFVIDDEGNYWRMFIFISDHTSYERVDSPHKAFEGGRTTGRFIAMLSDLPGRPLHETIPHFHDIAKRLVTFHNTLNRDPVGRAASVKAEVEEITRRGEEMKTILRLGAEGRIPLRITHNDTKFNNILFDKSSDRALLIIDLDTVMPGYVHYDFGDAIRTATNRADEDSRDLSAVSMDMDIYRGYAGGFLSEMRGTLNNTEIEYLAFAPKLLTYIMATRFLTDYIDGDNYYKIAYPEHNLQRARVQLTLLQDMEREYDNMVKVIKDIMA